jgi:hypothetical protein
MLLSPRHPAGEQAVLPLVLPLYSCPCISHCCQLHKRPLSPPSGASPHLHQLHACQAAHVHGLEHVHGVAVHLRCVVVVRAAQGGNEVVSQEGCTLHRVFKGDEAPHTAIFDYRTLHDMGRGTCDEPGGKSGSLAPVAAGTVAAGTGQG